MAIQHFDGFDGYTTTAHLLLRYLFETTGPFIDATLGRFGGNAVRQSNGALIYTMATPRQEVWAGMAVRVYGTSSNTDLYMFRFRSATGVECTVTYNNSTGTWKVWRGDRAVQLGTNVVKDVTQVYFWLEVRYKMGNGTDGLIEVWVDGVQLFNLTGIDTVQTADTSYLVSSIMITGSNTVNSCFDDLYIVDTTGAAPYNTRLGDCRVTTLLPTADTATINGTPTPAGAHWSTVDEAGIVETDFVTLTNTVGQADEFVMSDLTSSPTTIYAVQPFAVVTKDDAGAAQGRAYVKSGASFGYGPVKIANTTLTFTTGVLELDPATSAAWTATAVNALTAGYEVQ